MPIVPEHSLKPSTKELLSNSLCGSPSLSPVRGKARACKVALQHQKPLGCPKYPNVSDGKRSRKLGACVQSNDSTSTFHLRKLKLEQSPTSKVSPRCTSGPASSSFSAYVVPRKMSATWCHGWLVLCIGGSWLKIEAVGWRTSQTTNIHNVVPTNLILG